MDDGRERHGRRAARATGTWRGRRRRDDSVAHGAGRRAANRLHAGGRVTEATRDTGLRRTLGFTDLMLLTLGTVIGSGIFIVPGVVLKQTNGHLGVALLVWVVGGVVSFLGALTYAELGSVTPESGGLY